MTEAKKRLGKAPSPGRRKKQKGEETLYTASQAQLMWWRFTKNKPAVVFLFCFRNTNIDIRNVYSTLRGGPEIHQL